MEPTNFISDCTNLFVGWQPSNYSFNGKEKDDEVYGDGNSYDFDARMLDPRLGRWLSVDPKHYKYPSYSPYHYGYDSPIITIDIDGAENVVVIGGMDLAAGAKDKYKFINTGLKKVDEHNESEPNEKTTIVLFTAGMTKEQRIEVYQAVMALELDVNIVQVASGDQLTNYLNSKSIGGKNLSEERKADKVTDLTFFGHGYAGTGNEVSTFEPGHGVFASDTKEHDVLTWGAKQVEELEPGAFENVKCSIESCGSASTNANGESLVTKVGDKTLGTVSGWQGRSLYENIYYKGHGTFGRPGAQIASDYPEAGEQYDKSGPAKKITYESKQKTTPTPIKP